MRYLPLFADLVDRRALVVGAGEEAARKLRLLLRAGAMPLVVAETVSEEVEAHARAGRIRLERRAFAPGDLRGVSLAVVAEPHRPTAEAAARAARGAGVPVNAVDRPDLSTVIMPGIVDRDPILVAIGSAGDAPVLVRRLRERIEALLPARLGRLAAFAGRFRGAVAAALGDGPGAGTARRRFWEAFFDGPIAADLLAGRDSGTTEAMLRLVNCGAAAPAPAGRVALVGVGPGDPDLLTLRALRAMQDADVVVHDALIGPDLLDCVRRDAERIDVGKRKGRHAASQAEINAVLLREARAGRRVVRLKGGDPFIFGRGGEELAWLRRHGVAVEVVPGITAALGAAALAEIPLTHRDHAAAVTLVSGHDRGGTATLPPALLADRSVTLAVYMGVSVAGAIADQAIAAGRPRETPAALIERASLPDQRIRRGRLADLAALAEGVDGPALIVFGEAVAAADAVAEAPLASAAM